MAIKKTADKKEKPIVINLRQASELLGVSLNTMRQRVFLLMKTDSKIDLPKPFKIGNIYYWNRDDFNKWLNDKKAV